MTKRSRMFVLLLCLTAIGTFPLSAFWPNKLAGDFQLGGKSLSDPPKGEPQNTHLYLHLEGAAAQTLFTSMKAEANYDECLDDGSVSKRIKNMQCTESKDGKTHDCYFGIDVANQTLEDGVTC